jgi:hypothetical protein
MAKEIRQYVTTEGRSIDVDISDEACRVQTIWLLGKPLRHGESFEFECLGGFTVVGVAPDSPGGREVLWVTAEGGIGYLDKNLLD